MLTWSHAVACPATAGGVPRAGLQQPGRHFQPGHVHVSAGEEAVLEAGEAHAMAPSIPNFAGHVHPATCRHAPTAVLALARCLQFSMLAGTTCSAGHVHTLVMSTCLPSSLLSLTHLFLLSQVQPVLPHHPHHPNPAERHRGASGTVRRQGGKLGWLQWQLSACCTTPLPG